MSEDATTLCEPGALQRALARYAEAAGRGYAAAAFAARDAIATASVHGPPDRRMPIGCLAKLLTATLVTQRAQIALDAPVARMLDDESRALRGVTVRQLLEHTHGLDDSALAPPRLARGFTDRHELLARVAALERWARPGEVYSYGNAGAWLLAALVERKCGRAFAALVRDDVLGWCGIERAGVEPGDHVCAALGTGLTLTAEELARFSLHALTSDAVAAANPITPLPGWHPLELGVCLGWKAAAPGWFGHQSVWPGASLYLRVQPYAGVALVVAASEQAAALVALGVFGEHFPELFAGRARVPTNERAPLGPGIYAQAAQAVAVTSTPLGLCAEAWQRGADGTRRRRRAPATLVRIGGVHFTQPANELVPYLEAISDAPGAGRLWNGRVVLRRAPAQVEGETRR